MKIYPTDNRVVLEVIKPGTTPGGIIIPESVKTDSPIAKVIAAGPGSNGHAMQVKEGDVVIYHPAFCTETTFEGKSLLITRENEGIWGRIAG